jgi:hypothetical protein
VQHGSYTYTAPDGSIITVTYTADEQGFRAQGAHLPTPPPIPAEIQKSLDIIYEQIRLQQVSKLWVPSYKKSTTIISNLEENQINASWRKRDLKMEWVAHDEKKWPNPVSMLLNIYAP